MCYVISDAWGYWLYCTAVFHLHYMALLLWKWQPEALNLGIATLTSRLPSWLGISHRNMNCQQHICILKLFMMCIVYTVVLYLIVSFILENLKELVTCFWERCFQNYKHKPTVESNSRHKIDLHNIKAIFNFLALMCVWLLSHRPESYLMLYERCLILKRYCH